MIVLYSFGCGFVLGAFFALLGLPVPAPGTLAGAAGVVGVTTAFLIVSHFRKG